VTSARTTVPTGENGVIAIADLSSFHIDIPVDELDVSQIKPGQPVKIALDALVHGVLGIADLVRDELQLVQFARVADREHPGEDLLQLADLARKRHRKPNNIESNSFLDLTPGLNPVVWPKNTEPRISIAADSGAPLFSWLAENLYRGENGWSLE
jgi:hypothetical protein